MHLEIKFFTLGLLLSGVFSVITAFYLLRKKDSPGVIYFAIFGLISIVWYAGYIIELNSGSLHNKLLAIKFEYLFGIPFTPLFCYLASRHFVTLKVHPRKSEILLVSIIPFLTVIFVWTNQYHHLMYENIGLLTVEHFNYFTKSPGPWYYVHIYYSYLLVFVSGILFTKNYFKSSGIIKKQSLYILVVIVILYTLSLIFIGRYFTGLLIDITPLSYALAFILIGYNLQKHGMPEILPEARKIVMTSMSAGILVLDSNNRVVEINPSGKAIFNKHQNLGKLINDVLRGAGIKIKISDLQNQRYHEIVINESYYEISLIDIPGKGTKNSGKIFALYNITERKNNENKLTELNSAKDKLFSVIAHDLKNPVYGMMGISELLYEDFDRLGNDEKTGFIKDINDLSVNTHKMLESLLEWSRQQSGHINFSPVELNICTLLRRNILSAEKQAGLKNIKISSDAAGQINVYADENMADTVIRNLISNAIKFTGSGGEIKVSVGIKDNIAEIAIIDNGVGMSEENCSKLFRIDNSYKSPGTAGEKGTGLGLLLCKEFIEKNNGELSVKSKQGEGSTFSFTIPLSKTKILL